MHGVFYLIINKWASKEFVLVIFFLFSLLGRCIQINECCMKMLEYRVSFYKYTLKTIPLSILHGDEILKGPLTLFDILSSSIRKWSVKWYVCVFN